MFGYIKPHEPYLYKKDDVLYKSVYCGLCKSIGSTCGQMARMTLTYDVAFLSVFYHNLVGKDVTIESKPCIAHPIVKRPIAKRDDVFDTLAAVNVILARHKLIDDNLDDKKGKLKSVFVVKGYKKAKRLLPKIDEIVLLRYNELRALENADNGLIDAVSEKFGLMLADISDEIFKEFKTENTRNLFFYIGKWIYIIDALDDYDDDIKKGDYNTFAVRYGAKSSKELIQNNADDFDFMFAETFNNISENLKCVKFKFNRDLIENILLRGIPMKTKSIIEGKLNGKTKKDKKPVGNDYD